MRIQGGGGKWKWRGADGRGGVYIISKDTKGGADSIDGPKFQPVHIRVQKYYGVFLRVFRRIGGERVSARVTKWRPVMSSLTFW